MTRPPELSDVLWADSELEAVSVDYSVVSIYLRESSGVRRVVRCAGYIGYQLVGFWDEVVVEKAEVLTKDRFLIECIEKIEVRYAGDPPETGDPIRNRRSWRLLLIHLSDGSALRVAAAAFETDLQGPFSP